MSAENYLNGIVKHAPMPLSYVQNNYVREREIVIISDEVTSPSTIVELMDTLHPDISGLSYIHGLQGIPVTELTIPALRTDDSGRRHIVTWESLYSITATNTNFLGGLKYLKDGGALGSLRSSDGMGNPSDSATITPVGSEGTFSTTLGFNVSNYGSESSVLGGDNHYIDLISNKSTIIGGGGNKIYGSTHSIVAGTNNYIYGTTTLDLILYVNPSMANDVGSHHSTILNGNGNYIDARGYNLIGSGINNRITGLFSNYWEDPSGDSPSGKTFTEGFNTILSGDGNSMQSTSHGSILWGTGNSISNSFRALTSGQYMYVSDTNDAQIFGGSYGYITGSLIILGINGGSGWHSASSDTYPIASFIGADYDHRTAKNQIIGMFSSDSRTFGLLSGIYAESQSVTMLGGSNNLTSAAINSLLIGGHSNTLSTVQQSVINNSEASAITGNAAKYAKASSTGHFNFVFSGGNCTLTITDSLYALIYLGSYSKAVDVHVVSPSSAHVPEFDFYGVQMSLVSGHCVITIPLDVSWSSIADMTWYVFQRSTNNTVENSASSTVSMSHNSKISNCDTTVIYGSNKTMTESSSHSNINYVRSSLILASDYSSITATSMSMLNTDSGYSMDHAGILLSTNSSIIDSPNSIITGSTESTITPTIGEIHPNGFLNKNFIMNSYRSAIHSISTETGIINGIFNTINNTSNALFLNSNYLSITGDRVDNSDSDFYPLTNRVFIANSTYITASNINDVSILGGYDHGTIVNTDKTTILGTGNGFGGDNDYGFYISNVSGSLVSGQHNNLSYVVNSSIHSSSSIMTGLYISPNMHSWINNSAILGGNSHKILADNSNGVHDSGIISGSTSTIMNGQGNLIIGGVHGYIVSTTINGNLFDSKWSNITGGASNVISGTDQCAIHSGASNIINVAQNSGIYSGAGNLIFDLHHDDEQSSTTQSSILSGGGNSVGGVGNSIIGGEQNGICAYTVNKFTSASYVVIGGTTITVTCSSAHRIHQNDYWLMDKNLIMIMGLETIPDYRLIITSITIDTFTCTLPATAVITSGSLQSTTLRFLLNADVDNLVATSNSGILAGSYNSIAATGTQNAIIAGMHNFISASSSSVIIAGGTNLIRGVSEYSAIIAGDNNDINNGSGVLISGSGIVAATNIDNIAYFNKISITDNKLYVGNPGVSEFSIALPTTVGTSGQSMIISGTSAHGVTLGWGAYPRYYQVTTNTAYTTSGSVQHDLYVLDGGVTLTFGQNCAVAGTMVTVSGNGNSGLPGNSTVYLYDPEGDLIQLPTVNCRVYTLVRVDTGWSYSYA